MSATDTPYRDPHWKQARHATLTRDAWTCQLCLPKCKGTATHVDHIIDWRDGGSWFDLSNLQAACASCNVAKRNTNVAARARTARGLPDGCTSGPPLSAGPRTELSW